MTIDRQILKWLIFIKIFVIIFTENKKNMTMVIGFNSVHKHPKSPPHCGGRESETIADYLIGSHDPANSGYKSK